MSRLIGPSVELETLRLLLKQMHPNSRVVLLYRILPASQVWRAARSEERRVGKECRSQCDWSADVCSSDLVELETLRLLLKQMHPNSRVVLLYRILPASQVWRAA